MVYYLVTNASGRRGDKYEQKKQALGSFVDGDGSKCGHQHLAGLLLHVKCIIKGKQFDCYLLL